MEPLPLPPHAVGGFSIVLIGFTQLKVYIVKDRCTPQKPNHPVSLVGNAFMHSL